MLVKYEFLATAGELWKILRMHVAKAIRMTTLIP
jgi:hypothetical protein